MNNSEELPIKPPHDNLFRGALENPLVAEEFFRTHLPANVSMIDKTTLQIYPSRMKKMARQTTVEPRSVPLVREEWRSGSLTTPRLHS